MTNQQTSAAYFKAFNILFFAMLTGQVLFGVIAFVLLSSGSSSSNAKDLYPVLLYVVPGFYILALVADNAIFKKRLPEAKAKKNLAGKLAAYRAVYITRFALFEGITLFAFIVYLITGAQIFLVFGCLSIVSFLKLKPTKDKLVKELDLSYTELDNMNDTNTW